MTESWPEKTVVSHCIGSHRPTCALRGLSVFTRTESYEWRDRCPAASSPLSVTPTRGDLFGRCDDHQVSMKERVLLRLNGTGGILRMPLTMSARVSAGSMTSSISK